MQPLNPWLITSYSVAAVLNFVLPVCVALFLRRRFGGRWKWWFIGMLVFLVFQGLTRVPAMLVLQNLPPVKQALQQPAFFWGFVLMAAFTAGLFEEGGRWLAFRFIVPAPERDWKASLMLGAGHGGLEVFAVGALQLIALLNYVLLMTMPLESLLGNAEQINQARQVFANLRGWEPLLGAWERISALAIQIGLTVMVLQAFRRFVWWWLALAAHTLVDFTSVAAIKLLTPPLGAPVAMIATELLVTLYAALAIWLIVALRPRETTVGYTEPTGLPPPSAL
jgi:uncharacterized membrane protein YhfC